MDITVKTLQDTFQVDDLSARLALDLIELNGNRGIKLTIRLLENTLPKTVEWIRKCYNDPSETEYLMSALNEILECHGVEALLAKDEIFGEYLNTGDTYQTTLCLIDGILSLSSWGDEVEKRELENKGDQEI